MFNLKLTKSSKKEIFFQSILESVFEYEGMLQSRMEHSYRPTKSIQKKRKTLLDSLGITFDGNKYKSNGVEVVVPFSSQKIDIISDVVMSQEIITEVKSVPSTVTVTMDKERRDRKNQLIRYLILHILEWGRLPVEIKLIYLSDVHTTLPNDEHNIKRVLVEELDELYEFSQFTNKMSFDITGIYLLLNDNISELTMDALDSSVFYSR